MSIHLVITFMGKDKPGLVESIASTVAEEGGNWLESRMCHLGGQFAGVLRVAIRDEKEADLMKRLLELRDTGMSLTVESEPADVDQFPRSLVTLDLMGNDRVGIVSRITGLLASLGVNVEDLQTELTTAPMTAELLFKARGLLTLPDGLEPELLRDELEDVASDLMVDLHLHKEL